MNEREAQLLREKALAWVNPLGTTWQDLFTSDFMGRMPDELTECPMMILLHPESYNPLSALEAEVHGYFEWSDNGYSAATGCFQGTIDATTGRFTFLGTHPEDPWTFLGCVSRNGRVLDVVLSFADGYKSKEFPLFHLDVFPDHDANSNFQGAPK